MEKHKCKLCFRKFSNGRALGGHVRSHMMNLYPPQKPKFFQEQSEDDEEDQETESLPSSTSFTSSSSSSESEDELQEDQDHGVGANGSAVLQTKRIRSSRISGSINKICNFKKDSVFMLPNCEKEVKSPLMEAEEQPLSSITENTSEEDVAYWLMLLSRDKWEKTESFEDQESKKDEEEDGNDGVGAKVSRISRSKGKYRCETCERVFKSYQALGGHRASHKRIKLSTTLTFKEENNKNVVNHELKKLHECPVCFKVFSSGQALGGHKRSHNTTTTTNSSLNLSSSCSSGNKVFSRSNGEALIDLNLPAPIDDEDDVSDQFEQFSAVSDEDFGNPIKL